MQAIINGEMYEVEPAVKVIIDKLTIENAELKKENKRLEGLYQKSIGVIAATDCAECKKDTEPVKHGHWISKGIWIECSNCKKTLIRDNIEEAAIYENGLPEYCPRCGAKMDGGAEDE